MNNRICTLTLLLLTASAGNAAITGYATSTWEGGRVHILDTTFNSTLSFESGFTNPNGIATSGSTIYVGSFDQTGVRIFNTSGTLLGAWSDPFLTGLQGMELVGAELAIFNQASNEVRFYHPATGTLHRAFNTSGNIEGLAYDGSLLWSVNNIDLRGYNPVTGALVRTLSHSQGYTYGLSAAGPGLLALAQDDGDWALVSTATGEQVSSGNNGIDMFGLGQLDTATQIPEPGTASLLVVAAACLLMKIRSF